MGSWTIKEAARYAAKEKYYDECGNLVGKAGDFIPQEMLEIYASQCIYWQYQDDGSLYVECPICGYRYVKLYKHMHNCHPQEDTTSILMEIQEPKERICSKCGKTYKMDKRTYRNRCRRDVPLDLCDSCVVAYSYKKTCLERYGVENINQLPETIEKTKRTNLERYGVENAYQIPRVQEKRHQTSLERYGTLYAITTEESKEKRRQSCRANLGVDYPLQSKNVQEEIVRKREVKYGCKYFFGSAYMLSKANYKESHKKGHKDLTKEVGV